MNPNAKAYAQESGVTRAFLPALPSVSSRSLAAKRIAGRNARVTRPPICGHTHAKRRPRGYQDAAFTLIELAVSVSVMSILMLAIGSTLVVATHAVPGNDSSDAVDDMLAVSRIVDQIVGELQYALTVTEQAQTSITFTVADRDANAAPETIRYAWSGTVGDPLTRQYNGGTAVNMIDEVQAFDLVYTSAPGEPGSELLIVGPNPSSLESDDVPKVAQFQAWGYEVTLIDDDASQSAFDTAVASADVAYISESVSPVNLDDKLTSATIGVVNEELFLDDALLVSSTNGGVNNAIDIFVIDNSHYITALINNGSLTVASSMNLAHHKPTLAAGGRVLAMDEGSIDAALVVVETGDILVDASAAAGPRVFLPWGNSNYDFDNLNGNALSLLKRALDWASSSRLLTNVRIELAVEVDPTLRSETEAQLLNQPEL